MSNETMSSLDDILSGRRGSGEYVAMCGPRSSGKTVFLALTCLEAQEAPNVDVAIRGARSDIEHIGRAIRRLREGQWPVGTVGHFPIGLQFDFRRGFQEKTVYLACPDLQGEILFPVEISSPYPFESGLPNASYEGDTALTETLQEKALRGLAHARGYILFFDPKPQERKPGQRRPHEWFHEGYQLLINSLEASGKHDCPLLLVVTKYDSLTTDEYPPDDAAQYLREHYADVLDQISVLWKSRRLIQYASTSLLTTEKGLPSVFAVPDSGRKKLDKRGFKKVLEWVERL